MVLSSPFGRFIGGVTLSLLFSMWLEFFYKFFATHDPKNFYGALLVYILYLLPLHGIWAALKLQNRGLLFMIGGFIGLMAEWFLIGNSPWGNPDALQLGMFVFHGFYPVAGYALARRLPRVYRPRFYLILLLIMSAISSFGTYIPYTDGRFIWFLLVPLSYYFIASIVLLWPRSPRI